MKQSRMNRLVLIEGLESRCLLSGSSATSPLVGSTLATVTAQTALQAAASKLTATAQQSAGAATGSSNSANGGTHTATAQSLTYSKAVMQFLVSHGYLTQSEADRSKAIRRIVDAIVQIKKEAAAGGVSNSVVQAALNLVFQGKIAQAERLIVADSLSLPPEALKTNLSAKQLVRFVANLQIIGAGEKAQDASQWKNVAQKGTDAVLAADVQSVLGLPVAATKGKNARQLLDGAAQINLLGADPRSAVAWQGLGLLAQHKISVEKFSQGYSSGKDIGQNGQPVQSINSGATDGANIADGARQAAVTGGAGGGSTGGAGGTAVDPMDAAFAGIASNGTDTGQPADAVVVIQNNSDGTYTATVYVIGPDGQPTKSSTETFSDPDGDGIYTGTNGGQGTDPPDGYYPAQATDNGGYVYDPGNSGKSDSTSSSNKNSQSSSNNQNSNTDPNNSNNNSSSSSGSMPSPESDSSNPGAWLNFLLTNPLGAMELKSMGRAMQLAGSGGQDGPLDGAENPMAGILFGLAPVTLSSAVKGANGAVDYANDDWLATSLDPSALREVKLAMGKGVTDPPSDAAGAAGHTVTAPPSHIGTVASGTVAVSAHVSVAVGIEVIPNGR